MSMGKDQDQDQGDNSDSDSVSTGHPQDTRSTQNIIWDNFCKLCICGTYNNWSNDQQKALYREIMNGLIYFNSLFLKIYKESLYYQIKFSFSQFEKTITQVSFIAEFTRIDSGYTKSIRVNVPMNNTN